MLHAKLCSSVSLRHGESDPPVKSLFNHLSTRISENVESDENRTADGMIRIKTRDRDSSQKDEIRNKRVSERAPHALSVCLFV